MPCSLRVSDTASWAGWELQRPADGRFSWQTKSARCRTWRKDGPRREGILPSLGARAVERPATSPTGAPFTHLPKEKRLAALREGRMPSLQRPASMGCFSWYMKSARCRTWAEGRPSEGRHSAFPSADRRFSWQVRVSAQERACRRVFTCSLHRRVRQRCPSAAFKQRFAPFVGRDSSTFGHSNAAGEVVEFVRVPRHGPVQALHQIHASAKLRAATRILDVVPRIRPKRRPRNRPLALPKPLQALKPHGKRRLPRGEIAIQAHAAGVGISRNLLAGN